MAMLAYSAKICSDSLMGNHGGRVRVGLADSSQTRGAWLRSMNDTVILDTQDLLIALAFVTRFPAPFAGGLCPVALCPSETTGMTASTRWLSTHS